MHVRGVPDQARLGRVRVDVAVGPIARMFPAEEWQRPENQGGGAVFSGRAGEVRENVDREPSAEASPAGVFNFDAHIYDIDSGHPVPYLDVHVDVRRDGVPVLSDLALVPVARPAKGVAGLHYGNNVILDAVGTYQVTIRVGASPLAGLDQVAVVEFSLDFETPAGE